MPDNHSQTSKPRSRTRRRFMLGGVGLAGALIVGWGVLPPRQRLNRENPLPVVDGEIVLNGWVKIAADGIVIVAVPRMEMGQGVTTALPMLVAEELDVPLSMVRVEQAPIDRIYGDITVLPESLPFHPDEQGIIKRAAQWLASKAARELGIMVTGGSSSVRDSWLPMREAGAAARAMLVAAAARQWQAPVEQCRTEGGMVIHEDGRRAAYGELAAQAVAEPPGDIRLKTPAEFKLIGRPQGRRDAAAKVDGSAHFGIDARPEGLVYAAVKMCPVFGGVIQKLDVNAVLSMAGVVRVVEIAPKPGVAAGVAVIARSYWQAKKAVEALPVEWDLGRNAKLSSAQIEAQLRTALDKEDGFTYYRRGKLVALQDGTAKRIEAEYAAPFLAHATMEPINCTVQVKEDGIDLWVSTQVPGLAAEAAARVTGIKRENVRLHPSFLGGGFGRRLETDMVTQATVIALQTGGAPVQVIWSREDDIAHDFYRPAAIARFAAALDGDGNVLAWDNKSASGAVFHQMMKRAFGLPEIGPDKSTAEGEFDMSYDFPNQRIAHVIVPSEVPLGSWRSVGHSHNAFFKECFIDELAHAAGRDPVTFRRGLLTKHPRHLAVLDAAVQRAGKPAPGRAHGVALHRSFGSIVAEVAEVSIEGTEIRVHRVVCAVDCGIAVNPNIIAQQMESGIIYGLSAALTGEVTIRNGAVEQRNFHDYPVLRMDRAPLVETVIIPSAELPEGVGEPATPPIAPAVANAVFALTGKRLRSLPLRLEEGKSEADS